MALDARRLKYFQPTLIEEVAPLAGKYPNRQWAVRYNKGLIVIGDREKARLALGISCSLVLARLNRPNLGVMELFRIVRIVYRMWPQGATQ